MIAFGNHFFFILTKDNHHRKSISLIPCACFSLNVVHAELFFTNADMVFLVTDGFAGTDDEFHNRLTTKNFLSFQHQLAINNSNQFT